MRISDWSSDVCSSDLRSNPFVLSLSKHCPYLRCPAERTTLRQAQGEREQKRFFFTSKRPLQIRQMAAQRRELVVGRDPQPHDRHLLRRRNDNILPLLADAGEQIVRAAVGPDRKST